MDMGIAASLAAAKQNSTRAEIALSVVKQQHQQDLNMAQMLADAVKAVPPSGQGGVVDKSA